MNNPIPSPYAQEVPPPSDKLIEEICKSTGSSSGLLFLFAMDKDMPCGNPACHGIYGLCTGYNLKKEDALKIVITLLDVYKIDKNTL